MKTVYPARDEMEAHFVRSLLESQGIVATVQGGTLSAARGELPLTPDTLPSVWVNDEDESRALAIVRAFVQQTPSSAPPWTCPQCGESVESQFTQCWNCGHERPES